MSNQLVSSVVRGFGFTLGRKAANAVTNPSTKKLTKLDRQKRELIQKFQDGIANYESVLSNAMIAQQEGKMTDLEYKIIELQCQNGVKECNEEIEKLENATKKSSGWGWVLWFLVGMFIMGSILS